MTTSEIIIEAIKSVPRGKVAGYAHIALLAGIPNGARTVARILHSCSGKHDLPWWRIMRSTGEIALPDDSGGREQKQLLQKEGVTFKSDRVVDIAKHRLI